MHCKWVCTISFSELFSGCSLYEKKCTIHLVLCVSEKFSYQLYRFPPTWAQGGFPFLDLRVFSFSMQALFHTNSCAEFVWYLIAIFLWLLILYLLWQSVVIVTCCHWGFYFLTSNNICRKLWADGTIFLSCCLVFCTNPPLIIFHCPLSSHPKDSSTTIQLFTDFT